MVNDRVALTNAELNRLEEICRIAPVALSEIIRDLREARALLTALVCIEPMGANLRCAYCGILVDDWHLDACPHELARTYLAAIGVEAG